MLNNKFLTTTALTLLLATPVVAQTGTGTPPAGEPAMNQPVDGAAPMGADDAMTQPQSLSEMTVGDLTGTDVMDAAGDSIGSIRDVVQGMGEAEAVIGIGGFLGIGRHDVALPLSDLSFNAADQVISVSMTREELEAMPEYDGTDIEPLPDDVQLSTLIDDTPDAGAPTGTTGTDAPATDAPATDAPATDAPATDAPATDAPASDVPATDAPATDAPETTLPADDTTTDELGVDD
ncbi:MAG: PRC-barrel domain-containing protein [Rhodobacterales bacterium]